jgi:hypothetical protein
MVFKSCDSFGAILVKREGSGCALNSVFLGGTVFAYKKLLLCEKNVIREFDLLYAFL